MSRLSSLVDVALLQQLCCSRLRRAQGLSTVARQGKIYQKFT